MRKSAAILLITSALILGAAGGWFGKDYYQKNTKEMPELAARETEKPEEAQQNLLTFTNIYRGDGFKNSYSDRLESPVSLLIEEQARLDEIWSKIFAGSLPPPKPAIDFENQSVLVVMTAQKDTDGYTATINHVADEDGELIVNLTERLPGNACRTGQTSTRPVHVVAIGKQAFQNEPRIELSFASAAPCALPL